ncbi:MAG: hypothetical protein U5R06_02935 [candidate division KSB1 bacterium]|nr:hypothetical protein [candidate division KSB1 bacterium]
MNQQIAPRDVLGQTLIELAEQNEDIVLLDADFNPASKINSFERPIPRTFLSDWYRGTKYDGHCGRSEHHRSHTFRIDDLYLLFQTRL